MTINSFIDELNKLGLTITDTQLNQLERYYELLIEWNNKINLTGIVKKEDVYLKHFYDSLTLCKIIDLNSVNSLCDIGTGAGFPGLVIKILFPDLEVTLVDSLSKRINFLDEVIKELGLSKITTKCFRIEEYATNNREKYDIVTARAVASLPILLELSTALIKVDGYFIAMKGSLDETNDIDKAMQLLNIELDNKIVFQLPYENSTRTLISFKKKGITPLKYPRNYGQIKKKSL